jgi:indolepyruvate ferredoxin oxidoreductase
VQLAQIPEHIRGYGHVKERQVKDARAKETALLAAFRGARPETPRERAKALA